MEAIQCQKNSNIGQCVLRFYFRMKDLEDDAIRAQAVIAKAQELKNDDTRAASNQNGDSGVGVCFGGKIFPPFFLFAST